MIDSADGVVAVARTPSGSAYTHVLRMFDLTGTSRVKSLGRGALSVKCDVTREAEVAELFKIADKTFGRGKYDDPDFVAAVTAFTPMSRVADANEIKGTALYLASDASSFTTGLMLVTDGGCMAK